jgi:hypothetical protein
MESNCGGTSVNIPKKHYYCLEGKSFYPSFIDMYTSFEWTNQKKQKVIAKVSRMIPSEKAIVNEHIRSEVNAYDNFKYDNQQNRRIESWIWCSGYACSDGIARGTGSLIALNNSDQSNRLLTAKISNHFGFTRSATSNQAYLAH